MSDHIPDDVIVSILLRLPAKSLIRFKAVNKSWKKLISSPDFHKAQSSSTNIWNPRFQLLYKHESGGIFSVRSGERPTEEVIRLKPPFWPNDEFLSMVGTCNGLVCLSTKIYYHPRIYIWNPAIMEYRTVIDYLPKGVGKVVHGFGCGGSNNYDYKLVKIMYFRERKRAPEVRVYSLLTHSWRNIGSISLPYSLHENDVVFHNGFIHWATTRYDRTRSRDDSPIATFDTTNDEFGEIELPKCLTGLFHTLCVTNGMLSLFTSTDCRKDYAVWVMNDYGVPDSWTKNYVIRGNLGLHKASSPIGFVGIGGGVICIEYAGFQKGRLYFYDPTSENVEAIGDHTFGWINKSHVTVYKESIFPVEIANDDSSLIQKKKGGLIEDCKYILHHIFLGEILVITLLIMIWFLKKIYAMAL